MKLAKVSALDCYTMKIVALCIGTGTSAVRQKAEGRRQRVKQP
jgi:hypothetical protein